MSTKTDLDIAKLQRLYAELKAPLPEWCDDGDTDPAWCDHCAVVREQQRGTIVNALPALVEEIEDMRALLAEAVSLATDGDAAANRAERLEALHLWSLKWKWS